MLDLAPLVRGMWSAHAVFLALCAYCLGPFASEARWRRPPSDSLGLVADFDFDSGYFYWYCYCVAARGIWSAHAVFLALCAHCLGPFASGARWRRPVSGLQLLEDAGSAAAVAAAVVVAARGVVGVSSSSHFVVAAAVGRKVVVSPVFLVSDHVAGAAADHLGLSLVAFSLAPFVA